MRRDNTPAKVGRGGKAGKFTADENKEAKSAIEAEGKFDKDVINKAFKSMTKKA